MKLTIMDQFELIEESVAKLKELVAEETEAKCTKCSDYIEGEVDALCGRCAN